MKIRHLFFSIILCICTTFISKVEAQENVKTKNTTAKTNTKKVDYGGEILGGVPIGDPADFLGITYGFNIGVLYDIDKHWEVSASVGFMNYTGSDSDDGFKTEGERFIPVETKASYKFNGNDFGIRAGVGYAISASEGGEGGFMYSAGPFWRPLKIILIAINYVNISFGEGSLGALMLSGRFSLSKK